MMLIWFIFCLYFLTGSDNLTVALKENFKNNPFLQKICGGAVILCVSSSLCLENPGISHAISPSRIISNDISKSLSATFSKQSPRWEMARQKRTAAVKQMEEKGVIKVDTDDSGNQFLSLPWFPEKKYLQGRLENLVRTLYYILLILRKQGDNQKRKETKRK